MKGLVLYYSADAEKNSSYIDWLISEGAACGLNLELLVVDQLQPGFSLNGVQFAINRTREVTISWQLELQEIRIFNSSEVTLLGNNKVAAYRYMQKRGVPFAPVLFGPPEYGKIVQKPVSGHGGQNVVFGEHEGRIDIAQTVFQQHAGDIKGDVRFWIIGNEIHAAVLRSNPNSFLSNYSHGGRFEVFDYTVEQEAMVRNAIADLVIDYAGIDFIVTQSGELLFNEIEDVVGSRMLSELGMNTTTREWMQQIRRKLEE